MQIQVLPPEACHKYLGRQLCLDSSSRTRIEVGNRRRSARTKFHQCRRWLTNSHISLALRMKYLDTVVRPCAAFGLHVLPLTAKHLEQIAVLHRRMLRAVVGWRRLGTDSWADTMRRMSSRVEHALKICPSQSWDKFILKQQWYFMVHCRSNASLWSAHIATWIPDGIRNVGRPRLRWDDYLQIFVKKRFQVSHWTQVEVATAKNYCNDFVQSVVL